MTNERKIIIIIGLIMLIAASLYRFSPLLEDIVVDQNEIDIKRETLSRYYRISKQNQILENEIKSLKQVLAQSELLFFNAAKESLAAVDIKNILTENADKHGIDIRLIKDLPVKSQKNENAISNKYQPIQVQIVFTANINQLKNFLYNIATHEKILTIVEAKFKIGYRRKNSLIECHLAVQGIMKIRR